MRYQFLCHSGTAGVGRKLRNCATAKDSGELVGDVTLDTMAGAVVLEIQYAGSRITMPWTIWGCWTARTEARMLP